MTGLMRDDPCLQRPADQRQISNQIQRFMAPEFVREAQWAVQDGGIVHNDGVGQRAAANQPHFLKRDKLLHKSECPSRAQLAIERFAIDGHFDFLRASARMLIIHEAVDAKFIRRIDPDAAVAVGELQWLDDMDVMTLPPESPGAGLSKHLDEGLGGPVQDRQFQGVQLHEDVVDTAAIQRRQKMFGRRDQHALLHQAGGVADAGDVADMRLDFKIVEIHATENDSRIGRSRYQSQAALNGSVQTNAFNLDRALNCKLAGHRNGYAFRGTSWAVIRPICAFIYNKLQTIIRPGSQERCNCTTLRPAQMWLY